MAQLNVDFREWEKQKDFFENLRWEDEIDLSDETDGVANGVLFEFKKDINDFNKTLFQAIQYLSWKRIQGKDVPEFIALIDERKSKAYIYKSISFIRYIEKIYNGAPSKASGFSTSIKPKIIDFHREFGKIEDLVEKSSFIKINIDENCIIGWANRYYENEPFRKEGKSWKDEMFQQLKKPTCDTFKFINPWKGKEDDFKYIMDCLNDPMHKKELGAFYTPVEYCKLATDMVKEAIKLVEKGNDYVIIDRCGGTGNLEQFFTDEMLSHTIISTYELKEWQVLFNRLGNKVRCIIPPTPNKHNCGLLTGGNALAQDVFLQCKQYVNDPKCTVILLENPPYRDDRTNMNSKNNSKSQNEKSFVLTEFQKEVKGVITRDMTNQFIWSGFKYYLKKPTDSYIVFSPIKYWKANHIIDKKFIKGYILNRKYFHTSSNAGVSLIWWMNQNDNNETIQLKKVEIANGFPQILNDVEVKKVHNTINEFYEWKNEWKKIGWYCSQNWNFGQYNEMLYSTLQHPSAGTYLSIENLLNQMPCFAIAGYASVAENDFTEKEILMKTSDGGKAYQKDKEFLKACLIWSCLTNKNKCWSNKEHLNEICLWSEKTAASKILSSFKLNSSDKQIIKLFNDIKQEVISLKLKKFNKDFTYGLTQINEEFNTYDKVKEGKTEKRVYHHPELNTKILTLNAELKLYYLKFIAQKLKKYLLLK